jgi:hypothetical protein
MKILSPQNQRAESTAAAAGYQCKVIANACLLASSCRWYKKSQAHAVEHNLNKVTLSKVTLSKQ